MTKNNTTPTGGGYGWVRGANGRWQPPPDQDEFIDWLLSDPRDPQHQYQWAEQHGYNPDSLKRWKRDARFIQEWERRAAEKNISVDRVQSVVDALHAMAVLGDVKAANLYLQYVQRFMPTKKVIHEDETSLADLDDEAIEAELRSLLGDE
jgi:SOS response regulatory protein OraA/RecX